MYCYTLLGMSKELCYMCIINYSYIELHVWNYVIQNDLQYFFTI